jgi:hypothetical protein
MWEVSDKLISGARSSAIVRFVNQQWVKDEYK